MSTESPTETTVEPVRSGRNGPRSKNGCTTCRTRKVKCDELREGKPPKCNRCVKAQIQCDWDQPVVRRSPLTKVSTSSKRSTIVSPSSRSLAGSLDGTRLIDQLRWHAVSSPSNTVSQSDTQSNAVSPQVGLSPANILLNALTLSPEDLESFHYIPRSLLVLRFGKPWRWSMLSYVHAQVATREPGVLRAFIAVASLELRYTELVKPQDPTLSPQSQRKADHFKENASHALHLAIQDLTRVLDRVAQDPDNQYELEVLFSMWLLILHFGIYDGDLVQTSYLHLNGIRTFVAEYFHPNQDGRPKIQALPPAAKQLMVFICYLDVMLALGGASDGLLSFDLMTAPSDSPVHIDKLFEEARVCVPQLWGSEYPVEELLDDIENYRPLKLVHACQKLKLRVWKFGRSTDTQVHEELMQDIENTGQAFFDLLLLAKIIRRTDGRRVIWTVYHGCLDFYAMKIFYFCANAANEDEHPAWLDNILNDLLNIAHKAVNEDPQHVHRYAWPLRIALLKIRDPIHQEWLQSQIARASVLLSNVGIPPQLAGQSARTENLFAATD